MVHKTIKCCTCSLTTCAVLSSAFGSVRKAPSCKFTHSYSYRTISNLLAPFRPGSCQTQLHIMLMTQSNLTMAQNGKIALHEPAVPDYYLLEGKYKVNSYSHTFRDTKNMTFAQRCNCNMQEKAHFNTREFLHCDESREERYTVVLPS